MYKTIINEENTLKIKYFVLTNDDLGNYYYYYENCNALMENIDNFQVVKNKNLIYIENGRDMDEINELLSHFPSKKHLQEVGSSGEFYTLYRFY